MSRSRVEPAGHGAGPAPDRIPRSSRPGGAFGRLFPHLPPYEPRGRTLAAREAALVALARDAITPDDGNGGGHEPDNPRIAAGYTYLAQLVAHDASFDPLPVGARTADPDRTESYRTPALDLDCLYGGGPATDCHLYASATSLEDERARRRGRLVGFLFPEGRAVQMRDGANPGERDLPRVNEVVVRLGSDNEVQVLYSAQGSLGELIEGVLGAPLADVVVERHRQAVLEKLSTRGVLAVPVTVVVDDSMVVLSWTGIRAERYAVPTDGLRLRGRERGRGTSRWYDVPTSALTTIGPAAIGDPRNDQNVIVSQVHLALARFHNAVLRRLARERKKRAGRLLFEDARRIVRWHYQWIVVHDLLDTFVGPERAQAARDAFGIGRAGPPPASGGPRFLPIEFSAAAFRFGHAMARPRYRLNDALEPLPLFDPASVDDLRGGRPLRSRWSLQWDRFFGPDAQPARRIDTVVCRPLLELPVGREVHSLVALDLLRGWRLGLPSGESVARALCEEPVGPLDDGGDDGEHTPLFLYVLREAAARRGERLGPVGGRIVAETLLGLVARDPSSWLNADPDWRPSREGGLFGKDELTFLDIVGFAGLPVTRDEWRRYVRGEA